MRVINKTFNIPGIIQTNIFTIANERGNGLRLWPGRSLEEAVRQLVPTRGAGEKVDEPSESLNSDKKFNSNYMTDVLWEYLFS